MGHVPKLKHDTMLCALLGVVLFTSGCGALVPAATPESNHPVKVISENVVLPIGVSPTSTGQIRREELARMQGFLLTYRQQGTSKLTVAVPVDVSGRRIIQTVAANVQREVLSHGVSPSDLVLRPYRPIGQGSTSVLLSFTRDRAIPSQCGSWETIGGFSGYSNAIAKDFGCSTINNMARMVVRPSELKRGSPIAPNDSARAVDLLTDYRSNSGVSAPGATDFVEISVPSSGGGGSGGGGGAAPAAPAASGTSTSTGTVTP